MLSNRPVFSFANGLILDCIPYRIPAQARSYSIGSNLSSSQPASRQLVLMRLANSRTVSEDPAGACPWMCSVDALATAFIRQSRSPYMRLSSFSNKSKSLRHGFVDESKDVPQLIGSVICVVCNEALSLFPHFPSNEIA